VDNEESNPRRRTAQPDSEENTDLASDGTTGPAPEIGHKQLGRKVSEPSDLPFIHAGQLALFDPDDFGR